MKNDMKLFYQQSATQWEETLPIGNGSLGAMIWGGAKKEKLGLNEETLWSGYAHDKNNYNAFDALEKVRQLIFERKFEQAEQLAQQKMLGEYNESYLPLGNLYLEFAHQGNAQHYQRRLDIDKAIAEVTYKIDGKTYKREYFASYVHKAIFIKITGEDLNFTVWFESELHVEQMAEDRSLTINGQCPEHMDPSYIDGTGNEFIQGSRGQSFSGSIEVLECNGKIAKENKILHISKADCVVLAVSFVKEPIYEKEILYDQIKQKHIIDYQNIYTKVELYLGEQLEITTDKRLDNLKNGQEDNGLYALYFQYGRYLLIASSREGSLPANLQGIWSWKFRAPWSSNWTTNINTQMNYWHAQSCNLQECLAPYYELLKKLCNEGKKTAKIHYGCRGFVHHHNADFWCNTNPVGKAMGEKEGRSGSVIWSLWPMGGAWLSQELFRNYEYNEDKAFLENTTYPILKQAALFLVDWLVEHNGQYVTCPSTSPENRYVTDSGNACCLTEGSAMDLEIIREVFGDFQKTCEILGIEDELLTEIKRKLEKLAPFKIGSYGQLLEWNEEFAEKEPGHRHISHLYGLFPSELFATNEKMIEACKKSLEHRLNNGGGYTGWSCAWIMNVFAVLQDAENAYKYLNILLTRSTYPNLWDAHPPFQIDGNFGGTAGIANMLVQDRGGEVKLLPALPKQFKEGYVKGLRIKNKKTVDIAWKNGEITEKRIY
jgi:alpha-L-fucosidase 2